MVKGDDCMFTATAITESNLLSGLRYFGGGVRTHTVSMRYKPVQYVLLTQYTALTAKILPLNCKFYNLQGF